MKFKYELLKLIVSSTFTKLKKYKLLKAQKIKELKMLKPKKTN
jgi:hypothetical protein